MVEFNGEIITLDERLRFEPAVPPPLPATTVFLCDPLHWLASNALHVVTNGQRLETLVIWYCLPYNDGNQFIYTGHTYEHFEQVFLRGTKPADKEKKKREDDFPKPSDKDAHSSFALYVHARLCAAADLLRANVGNYRRCVLVFNASEDEIAFMLNMTDKLFEGARAKLHHFVIKKKAIAGIHNLVAKGYEHYIVIELVGSCVEPTITIKHDAALSKVTPGEQKIGSLKYLSKIGECLGTPDDLQSVSPAKRNKSPAKQRVQANKQRINENRVALFQAIFGVDESVRVIVACAGYGTLPWLISSYLRGRSHQLIFLDFPYPLVREFWELVDVPIFSLVRDDRQNATLVAQATWRMPPPNSVQVDAYCRGDRLSLALNSSASQSSVAVDRVVVGVPASVPMSRALPDLRSSLTAAYARKCDLVVIGAEDVLDVELLRMQARFALDLVNEDTGIVVAHVKKEHFGKACLVMNDVYSQSACLAHIYFSHAEMFALVFRGWGTSTELPIYGSFSERSENASRVRLTYRVDEKEHNLVVFATKFPLANPNHPADTLFYDLVAGGDTYPPPSKGWRYNRTVMTSLEADGLLMKGPYKWQLYYADNKANKATFKAHLKRAVSLVCNLSTVDGGVIPQLPSVVTLRHRRFRDPRANDVNDPRVTGGSSYIEHDVTLDAMLCRKYLSHLTSPVVADLRSGTKLPRTLFDRASAADDSEVELESDAVVGDDDDDDNNTQTPSSNACGFLVQHSTALPCTFLYSPTEAPSLSSATNRTAKENIVAALLFRFMADNNGVHASLERVSQQQLSVNAELWKVTCATAPQRCAYLLAAVDVAIGAAELDRLATFLVCQRDATIVAWEPLFWATNDKLEVLHWNLYFGQKRALLLVPSLDELLSPTAHVSVGQHVVQVSLQPIRRPTDSADDILLRTAIRTSMNDDGIRQHERTLDQRLRALGLRRVRVKGDGNCALRVLARAEHVSHQVMRAELVAYMRDHRDHFEQFVEKVDQKTQAESFDAYCNAVARDREWVGELFLQAFADKYHYRVRVISSAETEDPNGRWRSPRTGDADRELTVAFWCERHYDAVAPHNNNNNNDDDDGDDDNDDDGDDDEDDSDTDTRGKEKRRRRQQH